MTEYKIIFHGTSYKNRMIEIYLPKYKHSQFAIPAPISDAYNILGGGSTSDKLPSYWFMFTGYDKEIDMWYSWDEAKFMASYLEVPHVPELWTGVIDTELQLKELVEKFVNELEIYGTQREDVVIRLRNQFARNDFYYYVCKWVRPNHVQTDEHWIRNWKKAELISNKY